ncbi:hypothetical protein GCM10010112_67710 [Actinoplanes lobatus]|uniref:Helix-turn-helix domain-containing protein n=1 Tax=Actinoplanes lobatus TaxID=113568 RepID=A0A7W7MG91_9ACTN|nr:hypothetical protein [Actinoplanes lobatus]MBB4749149.1 hypothetical protein [Actinoplanes lobatus]GGN86314.1 hypothetical protein GCM10010112_67710 [Actinoplanes lobatus]GIE42753.1 hypothetical protein Alo02nite_56510 [Actinoplanes lobatus]
MIPHPVTREPWGTAEEIAEQLGAHIRPDTVRTWARRKRIPSALIPGPGRGIRMYPLDAAVEEERRTRDIGRSRATIALTVSTQ